ncbi:MAG: chromophore lyase CpcT/CpeT [Hydrococcus sp. C42_A2020_068]|nr:chromophore lyase CpcT/CpeT [Hydrococcus sp. C42_A2020_068]
MNFSPELAALGRYLAGEFDNRQQALAEPIWYVHLRLWLRPTSLFREDSLTLFAEQASIVNLEQPYRPRLLRLRQSQTHPLPLRVEHYMFKDLDAVRGASSKPELLRQLTPEQVEFLPSCTLNVEIERLDRDRFKFKASPASEKPCSFTYGGQTYQVSLGFEVTPDELKTHDKGIDPTTGKAIWGALMDPYRFVKRQDFSAEFPA